MQQLTAIFVEFGVVPSLVRRVELLQLFKRCTPSRSELGLLDFYQFVEVVGLLARFIYSKAPFRYEFSSEHEQVEGFIFRLQGRTTAGEGRKVLQSQLRDWGRNRHVVSHAFGRPAVEWGLSPHSGSGGGKSFAKNRAGWWGSGGGGATARSASGRGGGVVMAFRPDGRTG